MKILEILKKIDEQRKFYESINDNFITEAVEMDETAKQIKKYMTTTIYPAANARKAWVQTDSNVEEYFNRLIVLLSKLATLPKEEIEEYWDVDKLIKIDYLIHNCNFKLKAAMGGLMNSNISTEKNVTLYEEIRKFLENERPAAVDEFIKFYSNPSNKASLKDLIKDAEANDGYVRNFISQWLPSHVTGISTETMMGLANIAPAVGGINMGKYELLTALMFDGGKPNQGNGGDVMIGEYGVELKASDDNSGYGKIGGQQTAFVRDAGTIIANIQSAMRDFARNCVNLLSKDLQTNNEIQRLLKTYVGSADINNNYTESQLQYAIDQSSWATTKSKGRSKADAPIEKQWEAMTIDAAVIDIIKTINSVNGSDTTKMNPDISEVLNYAKIALKRIWSSWSKEAESDVSDLVDVYFNTSLSDITSGVNTLAYGSKNNKVATGVLIKDFEFFTKAIGFVLLKIYAHHEKFDYIFLINSKVDACYVLSTKIIDEIIKALKSRKPAGFNIPVDTVFKEESPNQMVLTAIAAVDAPAAATYGGAGRGTQVGVGTTGETWEEFNNRVAELHNQKTTEQIKAEKAATPRKSRKKKTNTDENAFEAGA